jgi:cob(I)alamin adenosyltransferase
VVKITKVYTKTGDAGETSLAGNHRISKSDPHIIAIGSIDELNAMLGLLATKVDDLTFIHAIQQELFDLGAELAIVPEDRRTDSPRISAEQVSRLEDEMDEINKHLSSLSSFVLPGGSEGASIAHVARTVCRRAESQLVALAKIITISPELLAYVNRLSDWLFVYARILNAEEGVADILWQQREVELEV